MKYIFLAIIITSVILLLYKNSNKIKEGLTFNEQKKYLKSQDNYYDHRKFPQVVKGLNAESKFVKLTPNRKKLEESVPKKHIDQSDVAKKIEKCALINKTKNCGNLTPEDGCGYCWDTDKIIYGDANGPKTDVCSKKGWVPPGPRTAYFCTKMKEQAICKDVKDCGDAVGEKSICGWCPLTGKGVVKKKEGDGWVPKYSDDGKCNWKKGMDQAGSGKATSKFLGWYPSKLRIGVPLDAGEGDCDTDADCGKTAAGVQMKCGHDGRNVKNVVDSKGNPLRPNQGWKDYCYDPSNPKPVFPGVLIEPKDCQKFKQMFPCVSKTMFTGPHSNVCLESLWNKSGCSGSLFSRVTDTRDYDNWSKNSYIDVANNMNTFKDYAKNDRNYDVANDKHKKCFGTPVNPCESRFRPRPLECSRKLYNEVGCSKSGRLNPERKNLWPGDGYVGAAWKRGQQYSWSTFQYKGNVDSYKRQADYYRRNPKANYDRAIYTNMLCYGKVPDIPYEKPCWRDFTLMMTATEYIKREPDGTLNFEGNSGGGFKGILPVSNRARGWNKEQNISWTSNGKSDYILTKETYQKKYFPFWNFVSLNRSVWNGRWNHFMHYMLKARGTSTGSGKTATAVWRGWNERPYRGRIQAGQGDCDYDGDCAPGLKCGHDSANLPGVRNTGAMGRGRDFCYDPKASSMKDTILFTNKAFWQIIPSTTSLSSASRNGQFYRTNKGYYLSKQAFMHESFPYWSFLRVASRN